MMEPIESNIEKTAGVIIEETGINALTVDELSRQMSISKDKLLTYFKNDDDILKFLAQQLEHGVQQLMNDLAAMHHEPEKELADLFKSLYDFFNRKSYFLELMFADLFHVYDNAVLTILIRVRQDIKDYLIQILEQGKKSGVFHYHVNTTKEADDVLDRFRFFMSDIPLTHKLIRDLKKLRE